MAITTPKINRIYKVTEFDLLSTRTAKVPGNMYICLDSLKMYYDETTASRTIYNYIGVKTVNDLMYNITPSKGSTYYCWEDNSLWLWMDKWITLYSDSTYPSAYVYDDSNRLTDVYRNDSQPQLADDNGLLKDGSVIIRDRNRIVKGKLYINDGNDNLTVSSYLGGAIRFLPNGKMDTEGEMLIGDEGKSFLRSEFSTKNNEMYVDYSEKPELDNSQIKKDTHRYKVYHEGNLDASAIHEITPLEVYTKLKDTSLPSPLELNVKSISGKEISDISLVGHTHLASDTTDFNEKARAQAELEVKTLMNSARGRGIDIDFNEKTKALTYTAHSFTLSFMGGVSGSKMVDTLSDTSISLTVDPDKHIHQNYVDTMKSLQSQINNIQAMDPADYYKKNEVDSAINSLAGTATPTANKPLLVNKDLKLPATSLAADKLSSEKTINFIGDITGVLNTDFSSNQEVELNAGNILSNVPTEGKALLVNSNGDLPGNCETASALDHTITISLTDEVTGSAILNTSNKSVSIKTVLNPGDNILQTKDLGITVTPLDETGTIPLKYIPTGAGGGLIPRGTFDPNNGYPSDSPVEGDFYIASTSGTIDGELYEKGDWCVYTDGQWNHVSIANAVISVNGKTGKVVLSASDVNAISKDLINYTSGTTIPSGYVVKTSARGIITGATIEALTNSFSVASDENSDVEISSSSTNTSTNGKSNLGLKLMITDKGYDDILNNAAHDIQYSGVTLPHKRYLNFGQGLNVTSTGNVITVTGDSSSTNANAILVDLNDTTTLDLSLSSLSEMYANKDSQPILLLIRTTNNEIYQFIINSSTPALSNNLKLTSINNNTYTASDQVSINTKTCTATLTVIDNIITKITTSTSLSVVGTFIPVNKVKSTMTTFIPSQDWQPATKKYVDDQIAGAQNSFTAIIGDGSTKLFTITHNLGSRNVIVQFRLTSTGEQVYVSNTVTDENTVNVTFNTAPATNQITAFIIKL